MKVIVTTRCNKTLTSDSSKTIDWKNSSDRKWLMNHMHWAMHNSRLVDLSPVESN
jgi:hypothetical protein